MSLRDVRSEKNLLTEFALTIFGVFSVALPATLIIIWVCS
jgi:hypothetical protein